MKKYDLLRHGLEEASQITERDERALAVTAVLQKAFSSDQLHPILVGGAAVEVYTKGLYASGDIDYILPTTDKTTKTMKQLGFKKEGRLFIHPKFQLIIEFPSGFLTEESYREIKYSGILIRIISLEDLIIDRLNAFKWGKASIEGQNILLLLDRNPKMKNLKIKAQKQDMWDSLYDLIQLKKKIEKNKINQIQATELLNQLIRKYK